MYTYMICLAQIREGSCWFAEVKQVSNPEGTQTIFSGIGCKTQEEAIIKSSRWLIDYMELQLMASDKEDIPCSNTTE